jgi:RHS repeat-associated protein
MPNASAMSEDLPTRESDPETSLYYYRARYYDATAGRFLSEDPTGFQAGLNFYRYAVNSASNLNDPFGLAPSSAVEGNITGLQNIFPGSYRAPGPSLVIPTSCGNVLRILHSQGFSTMQDFGTTTKNPFNFWNPIAHYGGWEARSPGPGFHFRIRYPDLLKPCNNCTLDQFHIDAHNPLDHPWDHLIHDVFHL